MFVFLWNTIAITMLARSAFGAGRSRLRMFADASIAMRREMSAAGASDGKPMSKAQLDGFMALNGIRESDIVKPQYNNLPEVDDLLVRFTLVDIKGRRYPVVGRVGESLM